MIARIDDQDMFLPDTLLGVLISGRSIGSEFLEKLKKDYPQHFDGNEIVWIPVPDSYRELTHSQQYLYNILMHRIEIELQEQVIRYMDPSVHLEPPTEKTVYMTFEELVEKYGEGMSKEELEKVKKLIDKK